jgi:hypothetical protein
MMPAMFTSPPIELGHTSVKECAPAPQFFVFTKRYSSSLFPVDVMHDLHIRGIVTGGEDLYRWFLEEDPDHPALIPFHLKNKKKRIILFNTHTVKRGLRAVRTAAWDRKTHRFRGSSLPLEDRPNDIRWMADKAVILGEGEPPLGHSLASL